MQVFLNDKIVDEKDAALNISDLSIQRGFAVFDFFRTSNNVPLFIDDYLDRFFNSASSLDLSVPYTRQEIIDIVYELIERNNEPTSGFKLLLTGGYSTDSYEPSQPNFIITQQALSLVSQEKVEQGIKIILHEYMRDLPSIKSTNYLMGVYLGKKIKEKQVDDVLYYNDGNILEFPRANVFIVTKDEVVLTPGKNVLHGITRKKVIELARKHFTVEDRDVTVDELMNAQEVFLTSTTKRLLPVAKVEDTVFATGKAGSVTTRLLEAFSDLEFQYLKGTFH